jgi:uncharacterized protein
MDRPSAYRSGDHLHLRHGPIELILMADGDRDGAFRAAWARFPSILPELVAELPLLRQPVGQDAAGPVARLMVTACQPHGSVFVTPMAAVAGAVADAVLAAMTQCAVTRACVNNGGDIALHLTPGAHFSMGIAAPDGRALGRIDLTHDDAARGCATSGFGGRSHSFGIADAVTVLAPTAAMADVAATLIANDVDLPGHPAIRRQPADMLQPDSDLGSRLVVTGRGALSAAEVSQALDRGAATARAIWDRGLALAIALFLDGQSRLISDAPALSLRSLSHA